MLSIIVIGAIQAKAASSQTSELKKQNEIYLKQLETMNTQVKQTREIIDFQYKPQILIELISSRNGPFLTNEGYTSPTIKKTILKARK